RGANAKRQREQAGGGEAGASRQPPERITEISNDCLYRVLPAITANLFPYNSGAAEFQPRSPKGLFPGQPPADPFRRCFLQKVLDFVGNLLIGGPAVAEIPQSSE